MIAVDLILLLLSTSTTIRRFLAQVVTGSSLAYLPDRLPTVLSFRCRIDTEVGFHRYSYLFFAGSLPRGP